MLTKKSHYRSGNVVRHDDVICIVVEDNSEVIHSIPINNVNVSYYHSDVNRDSIELVAETVQDWLLDSFKKTFLS